MGGEFDNARRHLLLGAGLTGAVALAACAREGAAPSQPSPSYGPTEDDLAARPEAANADYPPSLEVQQGDDDIDPERIWIDPASVLRAAYPTRATYAQRITDFGQRILDVATRFIDYSRDTHPNEIERMLQLYNLRLRDSTGKFVPYCAAGVSYCGAMAYSGGDDDYVGIPALKPLLGELEHFHFYPSPSVADIYNVAKGKRQWRDETDRPTPRPGWLVVFDFIGRPSHVGIVEAATAEQLTTIEFNTRPQGAAGSQRNGGVVARRERARNSLVMGYVATDLRPPWS